LAGKGKETGGGVSGEGKDVSVGEGKASLRT
jgi:hypothetical protein